MGRRLIQPELRDQCNLIIRQLNGFDFTLLISSQHSCLSEIEQNGLKVHFENVFIEIPKMSRCEFIDVGA